MHFYKMLSGKLWLILVPFCCALVSSDLSFEELIDGKTKGKRERHDNR